MWQFGGNYLEIRPDSGNLVAKICGNSGKKWQEIEGFRTKSWKNRENTGRNFKLQRDPQGTESSPNLLPPCEYFFL
jgi:hypothetical protein